MAQADDGSDASGQPSSSWAQSYYVPDPPKIPSAPGVSTTGDTPTTPNPTPSPTPTTTTTPAPAPAPTPVEEPGWTGPRFYTLLRGDDWNDPQVGVPAVVPYTFATRAMSNYSQGSGDVALPGFAGTSGQVLTEAQRAGIRQALDDWSQVSGLTFVEVSDPKQWNFHGVRFLMESVDVRDLLGETLPSSDPYGFNVVFNRTAYGGSGLQPGTAGFWTALHEIGHAIGLKHPFEGDPTLKASENNNNNTVMSYTDKGNLSHLGAFDVAAVQHLYGTPEAKASAPVQWFQGPGGSTLITGNDQDNYIQGSVGRDVVYGGGGSDYITLDAGDDFVVPGAGNDAVFGSDGEDVLYTGVLGWQGAVTAHVKEGDEITGTVLLPNDEVDTFYGVETIDFVDGSYALDPHGAGGRLYQLYHTAFGHAPDQMGFAYWMEALREGTASLNKVAAVIAASPEFAAHYAAVSDREFVNQLYRNSLDRPPNPDESNDVGFWVNVVHIRGRGGAALDFSAAKEHLEHMEDTEYRFASGVWYPNEDAIDVLRVYKTALDRLPDAQGLVNWTNAHEAGMSQTAMVAQLAASDEFQARFGGLSNQDFVRHLYQTALHRGGDANGVAAWTATLDTGANTRADVVWWFASSAEMTAKVTPYVDAYHLFA